MDNTLKQIAFVGAVVTALYILGTGVIPWLVSGYVMYLVISLSVVAGAAVLLGLIGGIFWLAEKIFPD